MGNSTSPSPAVKAVIPAWRRNTMRAWGSVSPPVVFFLSVKDRQTGLQMAKSLEEPVPSSNEEKKKD